MPQSIHCKVPGFLSSRPNWVPPPLPPQARVGFPPLGPWGETHSPVGKGWGDPIQTTGQKLWCSVNYNPFTVDALLRLPPTLHKAGSGMTLKDDGNGFLSMLNMCYIGHNKKLRREHFNSLADFELIFLDNKNKHGLIVYLLVTSRPLLFSEKIIFCFFGVCTVHFDNVIMI
jgi:hypothetical protein